MSAEHVINYQRSGTGMGSWIRPWCNCGWAGDRHYAHNDYQHSNAREQAERHTKESTND